MAPPSTCEIKRLEKVQYAPQSIYAASASPTSLSLFQELIDIQNQSEGADCQVNAHVLHDDLTHWKGYIKGPVRLLQQTLYMSKTRPLLTRSLLS